jgi:hypothetical protein
MSCASCVLRFYWCFVHAVEHPIHFMYETQDGEPDTYDNDLALWIFCIVNPENLRSWSVD